MGRMDRVREEASACTRCPLWENRANAVVGSGNLDSPLVLVGEAPGRKEDESGLPFVGSAGKLLDRLLGEAGLTREDVFITNIVKCRPPKNRRPKKGEVDACERFIAEQLDIIRPRVVAPMGNSSINYFFEKHGLGKAVVGDVHGVEHEIEAGWGVFKLVPLYHPAAAIYTRRLVEELERDMKRLAGL
ncbi:uracil-DNA glycosylase [Candidatus Bathyarchaeota archaeon]|nr:uracil-DNA glycosylase [Candidatus Bathyarchaeota archaeon]